MLSDESLRRWCESSLGSPIEATLFAQLGRLRDELDERLYEAGLAD